MQVTQSFKSVSVDWVSHRSENRGKKAATRCRRAPCDKCFLSYWAAASRGFYSGGNERTIKVHPPKTWLSCITSQDETLWGDRVHISAPGHWGNVGRQRGWSSGRRRGGSCFHASHWAISRWVVQQARYDNSHNSTLAPEHSPTAVVWQLTSV